MAGFPSAASPDLQARRAEPVAGALHTIVLLLALSAVAFLGYRAVHEFHAQENPNRMFFYLTTAVWEWILFGYIYWGVRRRGQSLRKLIGGKWERAVDFLRDAGIAFGFWVVALIVLGIVARALHATGAVQAARLLAPRGYLESLVWIGLSTTAGICEETIFRGYLQRQFAAWTNNAAAGIVISAVLFGAGHIYQGVKPTIVIAVYGLMFGILAEKRRSLRPGIITHAWHDTITGLTIKFLPKS